MLFKKTGPKIEIVSCFKRQSNYQVHNNKYHIYLPIHQNQVDLVYVNVITEDGSTSFEHQLILNMASLQLTHYEYYEIIRLEG